MGARRLKQNTGSLSRVERLIRSHILGFPFVVVNALTKWEVHGKENLLAALDERDRTGRGLVTVSNHTSLFDDPLVMVGLLRLYRFSVETKCWWSTACAANFNPTGKSFGSKFVRYFCDVSNMIFLSRANKRKDAPPTVLDDPLEYILSRMRSEDIEALLLKAGDEGKDLSSYLKSFYTNGGNGIRGKNAPLNQVGMIETIAKVNAGHWAHLFPEGGRSRDIHLRSPRAGVGKILYHSKDSVVLPICFYGTRDILPVGAVFPRFFKRVVVNVGKPVSARALEDIRRRSASTEAFGELSRRVMRDVALLRPFVLERYLGSKEASKTLLQEAQLANALQSVEAGASSGGVFVEPYAGPATEKKEDRFYPGDLEPRYLDVPVAR